jgi:hypothetical protein
MKRDGVGDVVGAHDQSDVAGGEGGVGCVDLQHLGVGHAGFREQDVHVPGHPAGDRMDGVLHVDPVVGQDLGDFGDLRLCGGHAQAGHDHHVLGVREFDGQVVGCDLPDMGEVRPLRAGGRGDVAGAEAAQDGGADRPVHA